MPASIFRPVDLPPQRPKRCYDCPLCGKIPDEEKRKTATTRYKSYLCMGVHGSAGHLTRKQIMKPMTPKGDRHKHHRPCDNRWESWQTWPGRQVPVKKDNYQKYRPPFELEKYKQTTLELFKQEQLNATD